MATATEAFRALDTRESVPPNGHRRQPVGNSPAGDASPSDRGSQKWNELAPPRYHGVLPDETRYLLAGLKATGKIPAEMGAHDVVTHVVPRKPGAGGIDAEPSQRNLEDDRIGLPHAVVGAGNHEVEMSQDSLPRRAPFPGSPRQMRNCSPRPCGSPVPPRAGATATPRRSGAPKGPPARTPTPCPQAAFEIEDRRNPR